MSGALCLTCGDPLAPTPEGMWAGPDGSTTCPRTGRPHSVRQVVPDPEGGS